ncbi:MAG: proline dehydrogenase family protein [Bacteroidota bacterium]
MESSPQLSFDNLENAFASKSNQEIRQAYWLFKLIGYPRLVALGSAVTAKALDWNLPVKGLIKATIFKQFCGGENIEECSKAIAKLHQFGVGSILDYSVEGAKEESEFDHACEEIIATVMKAKGNPSIPFSVFKVTGLARFDLLEKVSAGISILEEEKSEYERIRARVKKICEAAFQAGVCIFIDAEESWIQQAIDDLATENMERYNQQKAIVYNTIQLYRHDRLKFIKTSHEKSKAGNYHLGLKLVRGAYMEKERARANTNGYASPIQPNKEATDKDYNAALEYCLSNISNMAICAGSHNEESNLFLTELMQKQGIAVNDSRIYFSQLLGMSDHISFNLAKAGYNVAKYVPYGPVNAVFPYLTRRAQENTSIAGQMGRELSLLVAEKKRRKSNR